MSMDNEFNRFFNAIRNLIRKECHRPNDMIYGKIVSVDPLKIDIGGNIILEKEKLFLGQMCRPHKVTIPHTHKYSGETEKASVDIEVETNATAGPTAPATVEVIDPKHKHDIKDQETDDVHKDGCGTDYEDSVTIEIEPKLQAGDRVLMFAFNNNQMYYIAERIEE